MRFGGQVDLPFQPVFVMGAPRTGTTILHALICTADSVNDFISECSYFTALFKAVEKGWSAFDNHTAAYFPEGRDAYVQYNGMLVRSVLRDIWEHLGRPDTMALKDPMLCGYAAALGQLVPNSKFVVTVRDPCDVIASRIIVMRKADAEAQITDKVLKGLIQEYIGSYFAFIKQAAVFTDRLLLVSYEEMTRTGNLDAVESTLGIECRKEQVWQSGHTDVKSARRTAWYTNQYGRPLNSDSIGNYQDILDERQIMLVRQHCQPVTRALGFEYE